jgi:hypothetical protein
LAFFSCLTVSAPVLFYLQVFPLLNCADKAKMNKNVENENIDHAGSYLISLQVKIDFLQYSLVG